MGRWFRLEAPPGRADLLAWPAGQSFWPVDPALQLVELPLAALLGDAAGLTLLTLLLLVLAGLGPYRLVRVLGGPPAGALLAGLLVQLSPYLLRNLHDMVTEVLAVGILALAAAEILRLVRAGSEVWPTPRDLLRVGLVVGLVASSSPYYAVFLAVCCALLVPLWWRPWRAWTGVALASGLACALALAPLLAAEGGASGRLGPSYQGAGYQLTPSPLVDPVSRAPSPPRPPVRAPPPGDAGPAAGPPPGSGPPSALSRALHRAPGGATLVLGLALALALGGARRAAAFALLLALLGPALPLARRALGQHVDAVGGVIFGLLQQLPLTAALGNPTRFLAVTVLAAAVAVGLSAGRRRRLAAVLGLLVLVEVWQTLPQGTAPATPLAVDEEVLAALEGPTVVFPSGDPPSWHPDVGPKEALYLAGRAGVPVAYDYGRGGLPADLPAILALARVSRTPIGVRALELGEPLEDSAAAWSELPFDHVLVLDDRLTERERAALHGWLGDRARLLARGPHSSAWSWPHRP